MPEATSIYGEGFKSAVNVSGLSDKYEGKSRPGHFQGVSTVVAILLNMVQPEFTVFGEKDFQQLCIIEQMVSDLKIPVEIVRAPLIRDTDGLALSSRNARLSKDARTQALSISTGLFRAFEAFKKGEGSSTALCAIVRSNIVQAGAVADYVEVVDEQTLEPVAR
jgi:pantoate--beta-alanine ligase